MVNSSIFASAAPYHIISYGTLLGTEVFQSFIAGTTAFRVLPRPSFSTLQQALFPIYFSMQTTLPLVLALTLPAERSTISTIPSGIAGVLDPANRIRVLTPLSLMFVTSMINLVWIGPWTTQVMRERKVQETRDGKKSYDPGPQSDAMEKLNKKFAIMHGVSSSLNLVGSICTLWYGFYLGERLL